MRSYSLSRSLKLDEWMKFGRDDAGPYFRVLGVLGEKGCHTLYAYNADDPATADYFTFSHQSYPICEFLVS